MDRGSAIFFVLLSYWSERREVPRVPIPPSTRERASNVVSDGPGTARGRWLTRCTTLTSPSVGRACKADFVEDGLARRSDFFNQIKTLLDDVANVEVTVGTHPTDRIHVLRQQIEVLLRQSLIRRHREWVELIAE